MKNILIFVQSTTIISLLLFTDLLTAQKIYQTINFNNDTPIRSSFRVLNLSARNPMEQLPAGKAKLVLISAQNYFKLAISSIATAMRYST